ncbi:hypothetical protein [Methylotuvimicrobium sp.]|uniref:hypothetical protein n=1 Tax=Methylotuvimicrobium sp. TaxID=2822413 RepID=UPI003D64FB66
MMILNGCRLHGLGFRIDIAAGYVIVGLLFANALNNEKGIMIASPIVNKVRVRS